MPLGVIRGSGRRRLLGALALALLAACSEAPTEAPGPVFPVTLKDFWTETGADTSPGGLVTLRVTNQGTATHEFVVVRTDLPADELPLGADGLTVDEDQIEPLDELEEVPAGATIDLVVPMVPGAYVIFCNLEGHYLSGMRDPLLITDGREPDPPATDATDRDADYR